MERTLAIVKPDGVEQRVVGRVLQRIEEEGFRILGMRLVRMTRKEAEGFYAVHRERPFFESLTTFMSSAPAVVIALERDGAIKHWRSVIGDTDPEKAAPGTLRKLLGTSKERNLVHGSDSPENGAIEIAYFFPSISLIPGR